MSMNLVVLGLILDMIGVLILVTITILNPWHQKSYQEHWTKKYYWTGWTINFKIRPLKFRKQLITGFMPPKNLLHVLSFLLIFEGFAFQIIGNLR